MSFDLMWLWWGLLAAICAWKIGEGLLCPWRMLEWPFFACCMWAYFYLYMAYDAKMNLSQYLGYDISNIGQLMPLLCMVALLAGWALGLRSVPKRPAPQKYSYLVLWWAGFFFLVLGAVGGLSVLHAADTTGVDFKHSSAYWYLLFYVGYPGLAIALWASFKVHPSIRIYLWLATGLAVVAFMFPHVLSARRGPLYPAIMVLLLVPPLATRRPPNRLIFLGGLAGVALAMLVFLQVRSVIYNGGTWAQAFTTLDVASAVTERGKEAEDNEYVNNCQLIGTVYRTGKYEYGTGHLSLLIHWIPRAVWHDKPNLGEGVYSNVEEYDDMEQLTGVRLLGTGAAPGGVAETFQEYGLLSPLFWFGLTWLVGLVYARARNGNPWWIFSYVGFICASHWLVSQGFIDAFVPAMCFQAIPLVVLIALKLLYSLSPAPRRTSRRLRTAQVGAETANDSVENKPVAIEAGGSAARIGRSWRGPRTT